MNKIKAIIAIGGTGGHVFPGCSLADHLNEDKYEVELVTDKRGYKFLKEYIYTLRQLEWTCFMLTS